MEGGLWPTRALFLSHNELSLEKTASIIYLVTRLYMVLTHKQLCLWSYKSRFVIVRNCLIHHLNEGIEKRCSALLFQMLCYRKYCDCRVEFLYLAEPDAL